MNELLWVIGAYLSGTIPYSYWIGSAVLKRDIRAVGYTGTKRTDLSLADGISLPVAHMKKQLAQREVKGQYQTTMDHSRIKFDPLTNT